MKLRVSNKTISAVKVGSIYYYKGKKYRIVSIDYHLGKIGLTSKTKTL